MMDEITRDAKIERWFPSVLANAKEFIQLAAAVDPELVALYKVANEWFFNTFILHADLRGIERWEEMLSIYPDENATMNDRRAAIFMAINGTPPYTERSFERLTDGMYHKGAVTVAVNPNAYVVVLNLADDMTTKANEIKRYARLIVPANMGIETAHEIKTTGTLFIGGVVRRVGKREIGRLSGDVVEHCGISYDAAKSIFELDSDGNIRMSVNGVKPSSVMLRSENTVTPNPNSEIGDEDDYFYVDTDGNIQAKEA